MMCRDSAGRSAVFKLTPEPDIAATEAAALRARAGCSRVVHLNGTDLEEGALLLEGVVPGTPWRIRPAIYRSTISPTCSPSCARSPARKAFPPWRSGSRDSST